MIFKKFAVLFASAGLMVSVAPATARPPEPGPDPTPRPLDLSYDRLFDGPSADTPVPTPFAGGGKRKALLALYGENDGGYAKYFSNTDRHYTNGNRILFAYQPDYAADVSRYLPTVGGEFSGAHPNTRDLTYAVGFAVTQEMYTPEYLRSAAPQYNDWPYGGWLYGSAFFQRADQTDFENWQIDAGLTGHSSQQENVQKWIHHAFNADRPQGWRNQMKDEFEVDFSYRRKYRLDLYSFDPYNFKMQLIPEADITLGTANRYAQAGALYRLGFNLPDDFGPSKIWDTRSATGGFQHGPGFYLFGSAQGRYTEHDVFLEGNNFRNSVVRQSPQPFEAVLEYGFAVQPCPFMEFSYAITSVTKEFRRQSGGDSYGTLALTFMWSF